MSLHRKTSSLDLAWGIRSAQQLVEFSSFGFALVYYPRWLASLNSIKRGLKTTDMYIIWAKIQIL